MGVFVLMETIRVLCLKRLHLLQKNSLRDGPSALLYFELNVRHLLTHDQTCLKISKVLRDQRFCIVPMAKIIVPQCRRDLIFSSQVEHIVLLCAENMK